MPFHQNQEVIRLYLTKWCWGKNKSKRFDIHPKASHAHLLISTPGKIFVVELDLNIYLIYIFTHSNSYTRMNGSCSNERLWRLVVYSPSFCKQPLKKATSCLLGILPPATHTLASITGSVRDWTSTLKKKVPPTNLRVEINRSQVPTWVSQGTFLRNRRI